MPGESGGPEYAVVDGIKCYHPAVAERFDGYPSSGFDAADAVERDSFWIRARTRLLSREVLAAVGPAPSAAFLEIGCGTGAFLRSLAPRSPLRLVGSEVSLRGLRSAKAQCPGIELIQLDATAIPFAEEFDAVGAFDVIEHVDDDAAVLRGIRRALKPGGRLILTVPQHPFLWSGLDVYLRHRRRYTRAELARKLAAAGLRLEYATSFVFFLFPLMVLSRALDGVRGEPLNGERFARRLRLPPLLNRIFDSCMRVDELLIARRWPLPWGGTLLAIARK
jgi:SAM-dependent methyltransferase